MKLWQRVNNLTGNTTASKNVVEYLNMASKLMVSSLPEKFLWSITTESEVHGWNASGVSKIGTGSSIAYDKILAVYRTDGVDSNGVSKKRVAAEAPDKNIHIFDEANSILGATAMFPKFYKLSGKVYIKPDPDYNAQTSGDAEEYYKLGATSVTSISPLGGEKGVIVYAAPPVVDENTNAWLLAEFENVAIMYAASMDMMIASKNSRTNSSTALASVTTSLSSYLSAFPSHSLRDIPVPSLTWNVIPTLETLVAEDSAVSITSFSMGSLSLPSPSDSIPTFDPVLDHSSIDDALSNAQKFVDDGASAGTNPVGAAYDATSLLGAEDTELLQANLGVAGQELQRARGHVEKERQKLEEFNAKLSRGNQEFQAKIAEWGAQVQKESARIDNELKELRADLDKKAFRSKEKKDKFTSELQKATTQLQIDRETNSQSVQKFTQEVQKELQSYQLDLKRRERFLGEAQSQVQKSQGYLQISTQEQQMGIQYYNWAINELKSITGGSAAPQQQQQAQRAEERKADQ